MVLILLAGCGSESTHDKMMRIAQERSAAMKRQQALEQEAEQKSQLQQVTKHEKDSDPF